MASVKQLQKRVNVLERRKNNSNKRRRNSNKPQPRRSNRMMRNVATISPSLSRFLNTVVNPFGSSGALIPDHWVGYSVIMKDYVPQQQLSIISSLADTGGSIQSVVLFLMPGKPMANNYYSSAQSNYDLSDTDYSYWHLGCASVTDGTMDRVKDSVQAYGVVPSATESTIFNTVIPENSLAQGGRVASYGLKVWPIIETITSSDTVAIATIYAGQMSVAQFTQDFIAYAGSQKPVLQGIESNPDFKTYSNSEGCTVRVNTLQDGFLDFKTQYQWLNSNVAAVDQYTIPIVYITFTAPIDASSTTETYCTYDLPIYVETVTWLESQLQVPTPLTPNKSPIDVGYNHIRSVVLSQSNQYPTIVSGHTFENFTRIFKRSVNTVRRIANRASKIASGVSRTAQFVNNML